MDTDCLMLILEHACKKRVRNKATRMHATTATGTMDRSSISPSPMGCNVVDIKDRFAFMQGKGFIGAHNTFLLKDQIRFVDPSPEAGISGAFTEDIQKPSTMCEAYHLAIVDSVGDESGEYDDDRYEDDEELNNIPKRLPCIGWGVLETRTYTLALSRDICVSIEIDVVVIPTSWWFEESEGDWTVIQIIEGKRAPDHTLCLDKKGYTLTDERPFVIGWIDVPDTHAESE